ncbi:MAG: DUF1553 domain-containing protein [Leadbetterella sp.]
MKNLLFALATSILFGSCSLGSDEVSYSKDVKPILNKHCISCHGGVKKQGGYSLLFEQEALSKAKSGKYGIVPGDASASEIIKRFHSHDSEERMPYHKDPLKEEEIATLEKWIEQGAKWETHWAYIPVKKQTIPDGDENWVKQDVDNFIYSNAKNAGLEVSTQADPLTLARRVSLDLVGFPLRSKSYDQFIAQPTDKNYETYVNDLLASPHFGEKWTSMWLDLARYADTKGYERDHTRQIWKYRDWLIEAFNSDLPYDQFLVKQIAGDLLPNSTDNDLIATAFHRNTMTNDEGGTDNEEFRVAAVVDRVNTTWETLMGTTFACVQCHSHPYDPITHEEYYKFMSFFNNTRDEDTSSDYPLLRQYKNEDKAKLTHIESWLGAHVSESEKKKITLFLKTLHPSYNTLTMDDFVNSELVDTKFLGMRKNSHARFKNVNLSNKKSILFKTRIIDPGSKLQLRIDRPNGEVISEIALTSKKDEFWKTMEAPLKKIDGKHDVYFVFQNPGVLDPIKTSIWIDWVSFNDYLEADNKPGFTNIKKDMMYLINTVPENTVPIFLENPEDFRRKNQVFERGSFLARTKEVTPGVPAIFGKEKVNSRYELAKWLTSPQNPLVSRTMINRFWEQLFGTGLVETLEDMGSQGANPVSQPLLDHLSYTFMNEYKWSMKKMIKTLVVSSTYRQSSLATPDQLAKDQFNKYLARGSRVRLSAEQVRDQALAVSGMLNTQMFGAPVMPYQPEGVWSSPYNADKWKRSQDNQQYRRAIYTFWKRTSAYPSMINFDAMGREVCVSRRIRTNTPLQAFVTLNDSVYVDLAAQLAERSMKQANNLPKESISIAYKKVTGRPISHKRLEVLTNLWIESKRKFKPENMKKLIGSSNPDKAAMVLVCNSIFNLDEVITKN